MDPSKNPGNAVDQPLGSTGPRTHVTAENGPSPRLLPTAEDLDPSIEIFSVSSTPSLKVPMDGHEVEGELPQGPFRETSRHTPSLVLTSVNPERVSLPVPVDPFLALVYLELTSGRFGSLWDETDVRHHLVVCGADACTSPTPACTREAVDRIHTRERKDERGRKHLTDRKNGRKKSKETQARSPSGTGRSRSTRTQQ